MKVHLIAIGGAVMHNLAISLYKKGYSVTGSDDEIFEPSKSRLAKYGLLPVKTGWDIERVTPDINTVILGMHASPDNPELLKAIELGLKIMSFPEYLYEQTKNKKRIVIAGSHGKTTITAMIMHVFRHCNIRFDYMVGSSIPGFDTMVNLADDNDIAVFEGDEYLSSTLDKRPKFHLYKPDIAVINGIAWDHMNVFPTFENYVEQFKVFINTITDYGMLIYFKDDDEVKEMVNSAEKKLQMIPYNIHSYTQKGTEFYASLLDREFPLKIFGEHNMQNLSAAKEVSIASGVNENDFYRAIQSFEGTSKRLQKISENEKSVVFIDFAHSPSKVKATVEAVVANYHGRDVIACLELHTYSSLNEGFLPQYRDTLSKASVGYVYYNPHAIELKRLKSLSNKSVKDSFGEGNINVFNNSEEMFYHIRSAKYRNPVYLFMSSGNFNNYDLKSIIE